MTDRDGQAGPGGERGQLGLEGPGAVAVGAAGIGSDQQTSGLRVVEAPLPVPPTADRFDREGCGVVIRTDIHPAGVRRQIVDAVRQGLAQCIAGEVMDVNPHGFTGRPPLTSRILELPDDFLLLRVHTDHRLALRLMVLDLVVDVPELRVPVGVLSALKGPRIGLQTETVLPQQPAHGRR
ncbi:hypothetical protein GCM10010207_82530 [Streptomyces atratus]|nr:hypothetical protein GCM10010207_82530 [Streptomyces atratus]